MAQKDKVFSLRVGDYKSGNGLLIENPRSDGAGNKVGNPWQITFDVSKSADNKRNNGNSAAIEIYNLSDSQIQLLESDYLEVEFSVGYKESGAQLLVLGNVTEHSTVKSGNDYVTQLRIGEGYTDLNHQQLAKLVSPGKTVGDVLEEIRSQMPGVSRGAYTGTNLNNPIVFGWRLKGSPREMLMKLCEAHNLEYNINSGVLNISGENGLLSKDTVLAPVINSKTGLIDLPFHTSETGRKPKKGTKRRRGVQFKALLNTDIVPGKIVKLESKWITGFYRVNTARFSGDLRGNDWYVECFCSEIEAADLI
ncbi:putative tail protein [Pseudomonas phage vB_PsyM_KIL3b]|uniref:Tail protein n=6 Tax=Flaumdravirus TaxID=2560133 RepID=A0A142IEZ5_9CAUD|nr:baseplate hub [Pseudomonas phage vB_PsyM_KIL1]YP_009616753.1 baseplate hub [Pseudomonas phage vB_PsyM_KIL4]AMR57478.1 putative tail protein [Pseudomonas phage vB_PsyM_KIL2]AMR57640.1 putative tail protein [Pseudomonas phage vB_PsyM_KIL3]AMR57969.1 hypothetical protein vB_PsyM_KIL5_0078 [Pseudomonas phage vB_PsyM_KIL5]AMR58138.1 putative tail protein [Pseudomonas phage vB_PsyM_KIL3b]AMR57319.1 putative structural protein [Pseudomonas phage vB_PsyM_KIL1]